jgi:hypothetical protein
MAVLQARWREHCLLRHNHGQTPGPDAPPSPPAAPTGELQDAGHAVLPTLPAAIHAQVQTPGQAAPPTLAMPAHNTVQAVTAGPGVAALLIANPLPPAGPLPKAQTQYSSPSPLVFTQSSSRVEELHSPSSVDDSVSSLASDFSQTALDEHLRRVYFFVRGHVFHTR